MFESWKNRFWQLVLVCTFAVVLSVCNKAMDSSSGGSSSYGTAFADGSTVTISSQALPTVSHILYCLYDPIMDSGKILFVKCDATDTTELKTITVSGSDKGYAIYLEDIHSAGYRPCSGHQSGYYDTVFCK